MVPQYASVSSAHSASPPDASACPPDAHPAWKRIKSTRYCNLTLFFFCFLPGSRVCPPNIPRTMQRPCDRVAIKQRPSHRLQRLSSALRLWTCAITRLISLTPARGKRYFLSPAAARGIVVPWGLPWIGAGGRRCQMWAIALFKIVYCGSSYTFFCTPRGKVVASVASVAWGLPWVGTGGRRCRKRAIALLKRQMCWQARGSTSIGSSVGWTDSVGAK